MHSKWLHMVTWILIIVGALNWLLFGVTGWDIGSLIGGMGGWPARIVYILVGLSGVYELITHKKNCKMCGSSMGSMNSTPGAM